MSWIVFLQSNARWLWAGALLTFLSSFGQTYFISLFAGEIRASFELSHGAWGGIYTLGTAASAAVMLWVGPLTDTWRTRVLGQAMAVVLAMACCAMALAPSVFLLPLVIFALRLSGQGMMSHLAMVSMARWFDANRGRALAIAGLGFSFGEALLPIVVVFALALVDWRLVWIGAALVTLAAMPVLAKLLAQERTPQSHAEDAHSVGLQGRHWTRSEVLRTPLFWGLAPALLGPPAFNTAFFFQQVHFAEVKGWSHLQLVTLYPLYTVTSVFAMIGAGWLLDRYGTRRLMPWYQVSMIFGFLCFALGHSLPSAALGLILIALTTGGTATIPNAFWAEYFGTRHLGSIKTLATVVMVLGSAIGPGITGLGIDLEIGLETQYLGVAGYFVMTSALMAWVIRRAGHPPRDLRR